MNQNHENCNEIIQHNLLKILILYKFIVDIHCKVINDY